MRVHLTISGRVQGVAFRASVAARARELGVRGWVQNLRDGRVEVVAEGDPGAVDALAAYCEKGPPLARVDRVERRVEEEQGESAFEIRPTA